MRYVRIVALLAALLTLTSAPTSAQIFPPLPLASSAAAGPSGIRQEGRFLTAPVVLDGAVLFRIAQASPPPPNQPSLLDRLTTVETALQDVVSTTVVNGRAVTEYSPRSLHVLTRTTNGQTVIELSDAKHRIPKTIVTVTSVDAQYYGTSVETLAERWRTILQSALVSALLARQPAVERRRSVLVAEVAAALGIVTVVVALGLVVLRRRRARLSHELQERTRTLESDRASGSGAPPDEASRRRHVLALTLRSMRPEGRLRVLSAAIAALLWSLALVWFVALIWALALFPETSPFSETLRHEAFGIALIWIVTGLLNRLADLGIVRIANAWANLESASTEEHARVHLRGPTIARAVSGFKTSVLVFLAVLATFGEIGLPVGSVITIGGIITIGVSLAAQNFIRDFLNGFLVLFEDQYVVGDFVTINGLSGSVELFTLRVVQLRDAHGTLITIPHSTATNVMNHSRNWSRVDYLLSIDPAADAFAALELLLASIEEVAKDPQWSRAVLSPVEKSGIEGFTHDWTLIRATVRTAPLRQFDLRRAINAVVRRKFTEAHIGFGPQVPADAIPFA